jgi:uncharacterized protein YllA (UPF0747 family)
MAGQLGPWFVERPAFAAAWRERVDRTARADDWATILTPALSNAGILPDRLRQVVAAGGVVVTTGQQPGLFGGPLYTLAKALSALELADAIQAATGRPVAPVFWAATDDADFAEATQVWCRTSSGAEKLVQRQPATDGIPMAEVPLEGASDALAALLDACGSSADASIPRLVQRTYGDGATIGSAYVGLLRGLLEPLGIAVLDASHPGVRAATAPHIVEALQRAADIGAALAAREGEILAGGFRPQVPAMPDLSLVFTRFAERKVRVPLSEARAVALDANARLSPNVLLRPAVERRILPTVAYVAGPGEFSYFAQVTAVASVLGWEAPLAVPRWSGTILEPAVAELVRRCGVEWGDLADPHAAERAVAVAAAPARVLEMIEGMRAAVLATGASVKASLSETSAALDPRVVDGTVRSMTWRVDRLERRLLAGVKRRDVERMHDLAIARGALFPGGDRQERAHSFIPLLAVHGAALIDGVRAAARRHAEALVHGRSLPADA